MNPPRRFHRRYQKKKQILHFVQNDNQGKGESRFLPEAGKP
jgi:hypothetical protein